MTSSWLLLRVVELAATYVVHSTLLLGGLAIVMGPLRTQLLGRHAGGPSVTERLWKFAAVLPLATSLLSVFAGWSQPLLEWSITAGEPRVNLPIDSSHDEPAFSDPITPVDMIPDPSIPADQIPSVANQSVDLTRLQDMANVDPLVIPSGTPTPIVFEPVFERIPAKAPSALDDQVPPASTSRGVALVESQPASRPSQTPISGLAFLGAACLVWITLCILRLLARCLWIRRTVSACEPITGELRTQLDRLVPPNRIIHLARAIPDPKTADIVEPFAFGLWRWTIVLPVGIEQQLSSAEMLALLAHEVAHLIRRDPWWQCMGELLCTCLAFQPFNFVARRRWQQATELLCDDWAVGHHVSATSLANCLARLAELQLERRRHALGLAAVGQPGSLVHRVEWLLRTDRGESYHRMPFVGVVLAFALGLVIGSFGPKLTLSLPIEAAGTQQRSTDVPMDLTPSEINRELMEALNELEQVQQALKSDRDPAVAALIERLQARAESLRGRLKP